MALHARSRVIMLEETASKSTREDCSFCWVRRILDAVPLSLSGARTTSIVAEIIVGAESRWVGLTYGLCLYSRCGLAVRAGIVHVVCANALRQPRLDRRPGTVGENGQAKSAQLDAVEAFDEERGWK